MIKFTNDEQFVKKFTENFNNYVKEADFPVDISNLLDEFFELLNALSENNTIAADSVLEKILSRLNEK